SRQRHEREAMNTSMLRRSGLAAAAALAYGFAATPASAETARSAVDLHWSAPAECPTEREVTASIDRLAVPASASRPRVDADVQQDGGAWIATLKSAGALPRTLKGSSCAEIADAVAIVVAIDVASDGTKPAPSAPLSPSVEATFEPEVDAAHS